MLKCVYFIMCAAGLSLSRKRARKEARNEQEGRITCPLGFSDESWTVSPRGWAGCELNGGWLNSNSPRVA